MSFINNKGSGYDHDLNFANNFALYCVFHILKENLV